MRSKCDSVSSPGQLEQLFEGDGLALLIGLNTDQLERALCLLQGFPRFAQLAFVADQHKGWLGVVQDFRHLLGNKSGIDGHGDSAQAQDSPVHNRPLGSILRHDGDAVARTNSQRVQSAGAGEHASVKSPCK
jgi:hypothetical protein